MDANTMSREQSRWIAEQNKLISELEKENRALRQENQRLEQLLKFESDNDQAIRIVNHKERRAKGFMKTYCVPERSR